MSGKLKRKNFDRANDIDLNDFPERETPTSSHTQSRVQINPKKFVGDLIKYDIKAVAKNESQKELINSIKNNEITIVKGKPGSGKTYLAVTYALSLLQKKDTPYEKIYLVKSVQALKNEEMGFLKGSLQEKFFPFMMSYFVNIEKVIGKPNLNSLLENNIIEPFPLAYIRGCTLDNCLIISDESQNITPTNLKTLMSRIGENSKLIMLGDINQIDLKNKEESGYNNIIKMFKNVEGIGVVEMNPNDVSIRNPLIDIIEAKFDEFDENSKKIKTNKREPLND